MREVSALHQLGAEDKKRLKTLIEDLAVAELERERVEKELKTARLEREQQVSVLRARQAVLVQEKTDILTH